MQWLRLVVFLSVITLLFLGCASGRVAPSTSPSTSSSSGVTSAASATIVPLTQQSEQPRRGGVLHIMTAGDVEIWDPHQTTTRGGEVWGFVANNIIHINDKTQELEPLLASEWKYTDGKTLVISLRKGVKFHNKPPVNGREMRASDIVYSLDRILHGKPSPRAGQFGPVDTIKALDDYTVQVTFKEPFAPFVTYLGDTSNVIVPKEAIDKFGDFNKPENAIGTGPFVMKSYTPDVVGTLTRNDEYFLPGRPYLDGVQFMSVKDRATMMALYRTGRLELGSASRGGITGEEKAALGKTNSTIKFVSLPMASVYELLMNVKREPFTDIRVRKAFHLAIDRQGMVLAILGGAGDVAGPLSPRVFAKEAIPQEELLRLPGYRQPKDEDIAEAKRLLAEAGYASGLSLKGEGTERIANYNLRPLELAVSQLAKISVKLQIDVMDDTPFHLRWRTSNTIWPG